MSTLQKATSSTQYILNPYNYSTLGDTTTYPFVPGTPTSLSPYGVYGLAAAPTNYFEELHQCRFFYRSDPTASTVVNRMAELTASPIRNRRSHASDAEFYYFEALSDKITALLQLCALEYLVTGMAIPDYGTTKVMGNKLHPSLGRKRYIIPDKMYARNAENIILKKVPFGPERLVYLKIPQEESSFILNEGVYSDGTENKELYGMLVREFPEYVRAIREGKSMILLDNVRPILRKIQPHCAYPQPFLVPALSALKHKLRLKEMDHSLASKAIEAIMHIKVGSDEFPVTEDDDSIDNIKEQMRAKDINLNSQIFYKLYTAHTTEIAFVIPPLDALLSSAKYEAADNDIFMAMGFSRMLLVGESAKSNAGAGPQVILGPLAMLEEMRSQLLTWVKGLYAEMAELNNFTNVPTPAFEPFVAADTTTLINNAPQALKLGVISKDTYAQLYGKQFETEQQQIELEVDTVASSPTIDQQVQLNQQTHTAPPQQTSPDGTTSQPQLPSDTL